MPNILSESGIMRMHPPEICFPAGWLHPSSPHFVAWEQKFGRPSFRLRSARAVPKLSDHYQLSEETVS